jgi:hypothetical protein
MGVYFYFKRSHFRNKLKRSRQLSRKASRATSKLILLGRRSQRSPSSAEMKQGDRSLFDYGGDHFCKGFKNVEVFLCLPFVKKLFF